jgi:hypothetical protein
VERRQSAKLGQVKPAPLDQHVPVSEVAEVNPSPAFAAALPYPLDAVLALDHTHVAVTDDTRIGVIALPKAPPAPLQRAASPGRLFAGTPW